MKNCPNCNAQLEDNAEFCTKCGMKQSAQQVPPQPNASQFNNQQQYQQYTAAPDPYDHTSEFSAEDISKNKVLAMTVYLLGVVGIIIALLAGKDSPYVAFSVRQSLKITVLNALLGIIGAVLSVTFIVPIAAMIGILVLFVVKIITFVQICKGKAVEPCIVRNFGFLK